MDKERLLGVALEEADGITLHLDPNLTAVKPPALSIGEVVMTGRSSSGRVIMSISFFGGDGRPASLVTG